MLDFYLISDEQPNNTPSRQLQRAGGIEEEEFEMAQKMKVIESYADYYGKFRWSSEQIRSKLALLANCSFRSRTALNTVLILAEKAGTGLIAFGD